MWALLAACQLANNPGCLSNEGGVQVLPAEGENLPILRQVAGTHSAEQRAMQLVIRDAASFAQIPLRQLEVDFRHEMVLIVTLGRMSSDRYSVTIDRVWREGPRLRVATTIQLPPPDAPVVMARPYCIAVVPRCSLNVVEFTPDPPRRERSWGQG